MPFDLRRSLKVKTRTHKLLGAAAAIAAIAASLPLSITANADPPPTPEFPDPQGPGCDAFKQQNPNYKALHEDQTDVALAGIRDISTFNSAISGQFNPAVNLVAMLDNGPYVIFAPTNEAFAQLPPEQLSALKADPDSLTKLLEYHMFLGLLGPDDVKGQRPTQEGAEINVTGKGDDVKVNDTAKVVCGGIIAGHARIYLIDTVLDLSSGPAPITPTSTSSTATTTATTTETTTATTAATTAATSTPSPAPR
jgi:uncharacterized surface protein with fasciclin (FAS1) repeats